MFKTPLWTLGIFFSHLGDVEETPVKHLTQDVSLPPFSSEVTGFQTHREKNELRVHHNLMILEYFLNQL